MRLSLFAAALCVSTSACAVQPPNGPQQYAQADQQPSGPPPGDPSGAPGGPPPGYGGWGSYGQQGAGQQPQGGPPPGYNGAPDGGPNGGPNGGPPPYAQQPGGGPGGPPPGAVGPNGQLRGEPRFEAANVTHDGRLTLEQAQAAHWMMIVRNFPRIDRDRKGYVTWQDIREFQHELRAERLQQQGGQPGGSAGGAPPGYGGQPQGGPPPGYGGPQGGPPGGPPSGPPPGQQY